MVAVESEFHATSVAPGRSVSGPLLDVSSMPMTIGSNSSSMARLSTWGRGTYRFTRSRCSGFREPDAVGQTSRGSCQLGPHALP